MDSRIFFEKIGRLYVQYGNFYRPDSAKKWRTNNNREIVYAEHTNITPVLQNMCAVFFFIINASVIVCARLMTLPNN